MRKKFDDKHFRVRAQELIDQLSKLKFGNSQARIMAKTLRENLYYLKGLDKYGTHEDFIRTGAVISKQY